MGQVVRRAMASDTRVVLKWLQYASLRYGTRVTGSMFGTVKEANSHMFMSYIGL